MSLRRRNRTIRKCRENLRFIKGPAATYSLTKGISSRQDLQYTIPTRLFGMGSKFSRILVLLVFGFGQCAFDMETVA
jgi:hypothetical protein